MNLELIESGNFDAFKMLIVGASEVGKTYNFIQWLLPLVKNKIFDPKYIIVFAKNGANDPSIRELIQYCKTQFKDFEQDNVFTKIEVDLITTIQDIQREIKDNITKKKELGLSIKKKDKLQKFLFIIDDQISSKELERKGQAKKVLQDVFCQGRHLNISVVLMVQKLKGNLDVSCREQTQIIIVQQMLTPAVLQLLKEYDKSPPHLGIDWLYDKYIDAVKSKSVDIVINEKTGKKIKKNVGQLIINNMLEFGQGYVQKCYGGEYYDITQEQ